jgi:hypothetical protein
LRIVREKSMSLRPCLLLAVLLAACIAAPPAAGHDPGEGEGESASACDNKQAMTDDCAAELEALWRNDPDIIANGRRLDEYHVALATSLARKGTVDALLAAAAAVKPMEYDFSMPRQVDLPPELTSTALLARATALAPGDARTWFAAARLNPCEEAAPCPADTALARLLQVDPDNAAAWLMELERATERADAPAARAALARAARAPAYRDRIEAMEQVVLREWLDDATILAFDPATAQTAATPAQYSRWFKLFEAWTAFMVMEPGGYPLTQACDPAGAAKDDTAARADCLAIARMMDTDASSLLAQSHGRFLQARLATDPVERSRLEARRNEIKWLVHEGRGPIPADIDPVKMEEEIAQRLAGIGELERLRSSVAARGLVFPPDWHAPNLDEAEAKDEATTPHDHP